jgi:DNA-binding XRE family transcriptional regulator
MMSGSGCLKTPDDGRMTAAMASPIPPLGTDLSERRRRVGASHETMAAGIGLTVDEVRAIENGSAPAALCTEYATWLGRVESWPAQRRKEQLITAGSGQPFDR